MVARANFRDSRHLSGDGHGAWLTCRGSVQLTSLPALIGLAMGYGGWRVLKLHRAPDSLVSQGGALCLELATLGGLKWIGDLS